jgi:hypothetical protein
MIDEKKIDESARDYINKNGYFVKYDEDPCVDIEFAYKEGAMWAINEFLKDLWHDASEKPTRGKLLLTQSVSDIGTNKHEYEVESSTHVLDYCREFKLFKWLYIDDLLPKKGGAE